mmetsp:Transcript_120246/g.190420  ORF Transcript_120246/g.190420 Transcript_120246/m.190420 type:complete len:104 (-) Transcript_120246:873-1184(-)
MADRSRQLFMRLKNNQAQAITMSFSSFHSPQLKLYAGMQNDSRMMAKRPAWEKFQLEITGLHWTIDAYIACSVQQQRVGHDVLELLYSSSMLPEGRFATNATL